MIKLKNFHLYNHIKVTQITESWNILKSLPIAIRDIVDLRYLYLNNNNLNEEQNVNLNTIFNVLTNNSLNLCENIFQMIPI